MRTLLLASLALVAPAGWAQDVNQKVTFSAPAARASVLLKKLGDQTGVPLETTNQTKDEVLLVRVKDAPLKEVLERIAKVADADWRPEGSGFRLTRSSERANEAARAELALRAAEFEKVLKAALDRQAALPAWDAAQANRLAEQQRAQREAISKDGVIRIAGDGANFGEQTPGGRTVVALLGAIGAKALAAVGPNDRIVYALHPTRMQRPLPGNAGKQLQTFIDQQKQFAEAFRKRQPDDGRVMIVQGMSGPEMGNGDPSLGIGQAVLVISRFGDMLRANLTVADRNGDTIANASWNPTIATQPSGKPDQEPAIELSPEGKEFAKVAAGTATGAAGAGRRMVVRIASASSSNGLTFFGGDSVAPVPISEALRARLLRPGEFDPQSLIVGDALAAAADKAGKSLVASLPDSAIMPLARRFANEKVSASSLLGWMGAAAGLRVEASDAWIQIAPKYSVSARQQRINRDALGRLLRTVQEQGYARLGQLAAFATVQDKAVSLLDYDGQAMRLINAGAAMAAQDALGNVHALRLFGSLSPSQQNALANNRPIPVAQLTGAQRAILAADLFTSFDGPQTTGEGPGGRAFLAFGSVKGERTQILPDGIPANAMLTLTTDRQSAAFGVDSKTGASGIVTPSTLASAQYSSERSDLALFGSSPKYDRFQPAEQVTYNFNLMVTPELGLKRSLVDAWIDTKAPRVAYDGLPASFRDEVKSMLESLRTGLGNMKLSGPTRVVPPAP